MNLLVVMCTCVGVMCTCVGVDVTLVVLVK